MHGDPPAAPARLSNGAQARRAGNESRTFLPTGHAAGSPRQSQRAGQRVEIVLAAASAGVVGITGRNCLRQSMTVIAVGTLTSKGQVTIPKSIRIRLGMREGDRLLFEVEGDRTTVRRLPSESLGQLFRRQRPWGVRAISFQRDLRDE